MSQPNGEPVFLNDLIVQMVYPNGVQNTPGAVTLEMYDNTVLYTGSWSPPTPTKEYELRTLILAHINALTALQYGKPKVPNDGVPVPFNGDLELLFNPLFQ